MDIHVEDQIGEPVDVLYHSPKIARVWSNMVKLHLKSPKLDGIALLEGTRVFTIPLNNEVPTIAKVAKFYDSLVPSNLLSIKISSEAV